MAKLNIPEEYRAGVSAIRLLTIDTVQAIRAALDSGRRRTSEELSRQGSPKDVAVQAVRSAQVDNERAKSISEALAALYRVKENREESVEEFAEHVCDALEGLSDNNLRLSRENRPEFKEKLITLLGADVFGLATKIRALSYEHERTFCTARIVTDVRPVFGSNIEAGPQAFFVTHMLRLAYHEGSKDTKDFYVSMDAENLRELKKLIDRAESKAKSLKGAIKDTRILMVGKE